ncbi:hypothetical protein K1719_018599 [Acacia pycnantha]|nr:hypothetical protein K1719_018599 [Acacia pycnantha]
METIIYHCICVEEFKEFKVENPEFKYVDQSFRRAQWESYSHDCPHNCNTSSWDVFRLLKRVITVVVCNPVGGEADVEYSRPIGSRVDGVAHQANPLFPPNYNTFYNLIKFIFSRF